MAKTLYTITVFFFFFSTFVNAKTSTNVPRFAETVNPETLGFKRHQEKLTHFHFYFHDTAKGKNLTAAPVAKGEMTDASPTAFGLVRVIDDPLTLDPSPFSKRVGSAQGIYAYASQTEFSLSMDCTFLFTIGMYNGSTVSISGRNPITQERELPVVGGTGLFRFARGFANLKPYSIDIPTLVAIVEYDLYVFH